uniref:Uncharacterized protein n=1 Tax=Anguilla anguilla TaxID=7936 RepID=A0A0E9UEN6_ANGAN
MAAVYPTLQPSFVVVTL